MRTLEQIRAEFAYKKINEVKGKPFESEYARYVKNASAMILINGLGNTLAFYLSKSKKKDDESEEENAYSTLYKHINEWLNERCFCSGDAIEWIIETDSTKVFQVTQDVLALLNWMKKFAKATLKEDEDGR
ncbi:type III-B CRISPR module-associated protein Cmr5 [Methermicoccus shengliensis]|uniref:type III-B CRISPR module-associated protein Cmr5 n=1 Tax=Methermicoccus shengliensis TaxID=660064 RepID=UPI0005B260CE|nr:type III-B CRISPR module-associated protein Cmr5 [Methermicoccus shengliensis]